jgi:hypothetical protein
VVHGLKHGGGGGGMGGGKAGGGSSGGEGGTAGGGEGGEGGVCSAQHASQLHESSWSSRHVSKPKKSRHVRAMPHGLDQHSTGMGGGGGGAGISQ